MAVDTKHKDHLRWFEDWKLIAVLKEGQRALVNAGDKYLPKLSGQTSGEYASYIKRGVLFNATSKTIGGLVGAMIRKKPTVKAPSVIDLEDLTPSSQSSDEVIREIATELLSYGFYGILVDMPDASAGVKGVKPYMALYSGSDILNWYVQRVGSVLKTVMVTLLETRLDEDPEDPFNFIERFIIRVCFIDQKDGKYKQQIWRKEDKKGSKEQWIKEGEEIVPVKQGMMLDEIPFVFLSAEGCYPIPSKPPMLDLANLNIKHWQLSTDYYHGLHYCAIPTPWAAGFETGSNLYIGAQKAWVSNEPSAKCGYLEFSGQGIGAIEKGLTNLEKLMAVAGARLLEEQKAGVETAEAIRLRASGDGATMSTIASSIEEGLKKAFDLMAQWMGVSETSEVVMTRDFASSKLTPEEITALLQAVQAGQISQDTFLYNLQAGEILPPDRTIEDEKDLITVQSEEDFQEGQKRMKINAKNQMQFAPKNGEEDDDEKGKSSKGNIINIGA